MSSFPDPTRNSSSFALLSQSSYGGRDDRDEDNRSNYTSDNSIVDLSKETSGNGSQQQLQTKPPTPSVSKLVRSAEFDTVCLL